MLYSKVRCRRIAGGEDRVGWMLMKRLTLKARYLYGVEKHVTKPVNLKDSTGQRHDCVVIKDNLLLSEVFAYVPYGNELQSSRDAVIERFRQTKTRTRMMYTTSWQRFPLHANAFS